MKLKTSYEELDALTERLELTPLGVFSYKHGFRAAESHHQSKVDKLMQIVEMQRKALKHTNEFCLCNRNTYGFDYHEDHPVIGKPKSGSRWLTPRDYNEARLLETDKMLKELK